MDDRMSGGAVRFRDLKEGNYPEAPVEITDDELDKLTAMFPSVVVDCWAPWCGPCQLMSPTIDELAAEMKGRVVFAKLNTDENEGTAARFRIMAIPTLLFFRKGELAERTMGVLAKKNLQEIIKKTFG
ncbi:MAG: thioredoxin [Thermoplasmata archaeon]